jgi:hypothetical protein
MIAKINAKQIVPIILGSLTIREKYRGNPVIFTEPRVRRNSAKAMVIITVIQRF